MYRSLASHSGQISTSLVCRGAMCNPAQYSARLVVPETRVLASTSTVMLFTRSFRHFLSPTCRMVLFRRDGFNDELGKLFELVQVTCRCAPYDGALAKRNLEPFPIFVLRQISLVAYLEGTTQTDSISLSNSWEVGYYRPIFLITLLKSWK